MTTKITLPGIGNSGAAHWQTYWERADKSFVRFSPTSWDQPDLNDWMTALDQAVAASEEPPILVAHSLACLLVAHWQAHSSLPILAALLVAVPDPKSKVFPREASSFGPASLGPLRFPARIVASENDPYGSPAYTRETARAWQVPVTFVGAVGHINGAAGLGEWREGKAILADLQESAQAAKAEGS